MPSIEMSARQPARLPNTGKLAVMVSRPPTTIRPEVSSVASVPCSRAHMRNKPIRGVKPMPYRDGCGEGCAVNSDNNMSQRSLHPDGMPAAIVNNSRHSHRLARSARVEDHCDGPCLQHHTEKVACCPFRSHVKQDAVASRSLEGQSKVVLEKADVCLVLLKRVSAACKPVTRLV